MTGDRLSQITTIIGLAMRFGIVDVMEEMERSQGFEIIKRGSRDWYSRKDWVESIISKDREFVRIVAVRARNPGKGSFKKMIAGIKSEGLTPLVICPLPDMVSILTKWGWRPLGFFEKDYIWAEVSK